MGIAQKIRRKLIKNIGIWPPMLGAGIYIDELTPDLKYISVKMKLRPWNANYVGTHYGGSLYSMTDPFYMLMLIENLGKDFIVWDKAAKIDFKKPGKGIVSCRFYLDENTLNNIRKQTIENGKGVFHFGVDVVSQKNEVIAHVDKALYVKYKKFDKTQPNKS